jgi:hypothetical protein
VDIENILNSLGLDLTNPEVRRGAMEAIDAILASRQPDLPLGDLGNASGEEDIEIDPDLLQPSIKKQSQGSDDDVEINDEEDILKDVKHNDSETAPESPMSNDTETGDSDDESNADSDGTDVDPGSSSSGSTDEQDTDLEGEEPSSDTFDDKAESKEGVNPDDTDDSADEDQDYEADDGAQADDDASDDSDAADDELNFDDDFEDGSNADDESEDGQDVDSLDGEDSGITDDEDKTESDGSEEDIDEDDLLDNELKEPYEDQAEKAKQEARRIKRERTIQAAEKHLVDAKAKNKSASLIRELEKAIEALKELQEAAKNLKDISDEEFNLMVNRVFDAIDALGDSELTYTSDEERQLKAQEIKADLEDRQTQAELSAEDVAKIRAETQAIKAREKENAKYQRRSRGSFKGFKDFLNSLYRAIALQVHTEETRDDSWSAINRRYSGTSILQPGKKFDELPNKKIPVIDFYFDQSGSWDEDDIKVGEKAVAALTEMEEKGQIKINIYYFSNHVFSDAQSARNEGGTMAWNDIVKNVIATQATNVIIMTDSDMENRWSYDGYWAGDEGKPAAYTVPGYVWYLWRDGSNAPRLPRDLKGRGGVQQFSFSSGDI